MQYYAQLFFTNVFSTIALQIAVFIALAKSQNREWTAARHLEKKSLLSRMQPAKNGDDIRARDDALHLSRPCSLSLSLSPLSPISRSVPSGAPSFPLGTGHTQMGPSILRSHCYSKYPAPSLPPSRSAMLQCLATPGHCYQYCYYYRYCCRLRPSGEWKSRRPVEPAATSSVALEANYTLPPSPLGPPIVAFIPPLHFPPFFRKVFDLDRPRKPQWYQSLLSDEYINNVHRI